jgi:hypothetical protein
VAAPNEIANTQLAPSENRAHKSADGRVATEAACLIETDSGKEESESGPWHQPRKEKRRKKGEMV